MFALSSFGFSVTLGRHHSKTAERILFARVWHVNSLSCGSRRFAPSGLNQRADAAPDDFAW
jgi:hypothetical protein